MRVMKIVILDYIQLVEQHITILKELGNVVRYDGPPLTEMENIERIAGAEILISGWTNITTNIIQNSPSLKFIVVPAVGYENVDVKAASQMGIMVSNCPTHNTQAVAEHTIALMLLIARRVTEANTHLKNGEWKPSEYMGIELRNKRLGLIGYGNIGRTVAHIAQNIGMKVSHANSKTPPDELDQLIANSDFVSLHLPVTNNTRHLINERRLRLMKKDAYLINTARGAILDQKALIKVIKSGHLAGVALDVFENEPHAGKLSGELLDLVRCHNVVATPHMGFNTQEASYRLGEELIANIQAIMSGNPINIVS